MEEQGGLPDTRKFQEGEYMYIERAIESTIRQVSKEKSVVMICGPRGCGKTTMLQHLAGKDRSYVSLEDPKACNLARSDPKAFLREYKAPLIIDEIQLAPELLPVLKAVAGAAKRKGVYWLACSNAGRVQEIHEAFGSLLTELQLFGLSDAEIYEYESIPYTTSADRLMKRVEMCPERDLHEIFSRIFTGSFPELYKEPDEDPSTFYARYIDNLLLEDFAEIVESGNEESFRRFLTVAAASAAKPLAYEEMAHSCAISVPTLMKWMKMLQDTYLVRILEPFSDPGLKRTLKISVMHFLDTGLAAYLLKWNDPVSLQNGYNAAAFFETHVYEEILKSYLNAGTEPDLFYFRDKDRHELALILEEGELISPISIKMSPSPGTPALRNFKALEPLRGAAGPPRKIAVGNILCPAAELRPLDAETWVVPCWLI